MSKFKPRFWRGVSMLWILLSGIIVLGGLARPLNAQQFNHLDPLYFTMPLGGAAPLPQALTVTSNSGLAIQFSVTINSSSGGSWLTLSSTGCCANTAKALSVGIDRDVSARLSAGTYTGSFTLASSGNTTAVTVPVTLVVRAPSTPFLNNLPGGLTFSMPVNGQPSSQVFQVRNAGVGTLTWTASARTFNGGSFLTVSSASGTAPSLVTVGVNAKNLPSGGTVAGIYTGQLVFTGGGTSVTVPVTVSVGGESLTQINPLSFAMPLGGDAPPSQTVVVTGSAGAAIQYHVDTATGTGGDWLTVSESGCCVHSPTPLTIGVDGTVAVGLPAGTYAAQVILTPTDRDAAQTIPVTLVVAPHASAFFDNVPGALHFSMKTQGASPASQLMQIRNAGSGALNWTVIPTTADGGKWLTVSPVNGRAPTTMSVGIAAQNLPNGGAINGIYTGNLLFEVVGSTTTVTVPVDVSVGGTSLVQVNPLNFNMPLGGQVPLPQVIEAASTSSTPIQFRVSVVTGTGGQWLTTSLSGCCVNTPKSIVAGIDQTAALSLPAGTYTAEVILTPSGSGAAAMTVPVSLTVAPPASSFFDNVPGALQFSIPKNGQDPTSQVFQIRNGGSGTLGWTVTASTADLGKWLVVSPVSAVAPSLVTVGVSAKNLPAGAAVAGIYTGQLVFTGGGTSVTVPVTVSVGGESLTQMNPLSFVMPLGGDAPPSQTVVVTGSGGAAIQYRIDTATGTGGNWLTVSNSGCCVNSPRPLTIGVDGEAAVGLAAGTYTAQVILAPSGGDAAMTIPVTLIVAPHASAFFDNVPGALHFSMKTRGSSPVTQLMQLRNAGSGTLNWIVIPTTADGGKWLTVSAANGAAPTTLSVGIAAQNLPNAGAVNGIYTGNLLFEVAGSTTTVTVPVEVSVGGTSLVQVNPLSFSMPLSGQAPLSQIIQATSSSSTPIQFRVSVVTGTGGQWLTTSVSGCCANTPRSIVASIDPTVALSLPAGTYTAEIILTPSGSGAAAMTVPVSLTVGSPANPFFDNLPGELYYSAKPSAGNPASQILRLRNQGAGQLNWTVIPTTSDGGNWLSVSAATGAAPSVVTVGVLSQNLPNGGATAGIYTAQLLFMSSYGNVTVPVVMHLDSNTFVQSNGITFNVPPDAAANDLPIASIGASIQFASYAMAGNGGSWLTSSLSGCCANTPRVNTLTVDTTELPNGAYTGQVVLDAGWIAQVAQVNLNVGGPVSLKCIAITAASHSIVKGTNEQFTATGTYTDGSTANLSTKVAWKSSSTAVATINTSGLATSVAVGSTNIGAATSGITASSFALAVTPPPLKSIAITAASHSIVKGTTEQFTATGTYSDGSTANLATKVTWTSSSTSVATINAAGLATSVALGSTNIGAALTGVTSSAFALAVTAPTLKSIAITAPSHSIVKGATEQFIATGTYSDGSTANITTKVAWTSSSPAFSTINTAGLATSVAIGSTNISASLTGITSGSFALAVTAPTLKAIAITAPSHSIVKGTAEQFIATATYSDGSTANITTKAAWTSSSPAFATINTAGLATSVSIGSTNISASLTGIASSSFALAVTAPTLKAIAITAPSHSIVKGTTEQFIATGTYSDGLTANITRVVTWTSSSFAVATVNASGLAAGVALGNTNISAAKTGVTSSTFSLAVTAH